MIDSLLRQLRGLRHKATGYRGMKRRRRSMALLERSGLFDRAWYLKTYADVRDSGFDPLRHYLEDGWREGRDPSPGFCTTAYLKANSDVAALGVDPLLHYIEHGKAEGRGALHQDAPLRPVFDPVEKFGAAAPCAAYDLPAEKVVSWSRAGRIAGEAASLIAVGGQTIAKAGEAESREQIDCALARLAWLSGDQDETPADAQAQCGSVLELQDASFIGGSTLRVRWVPDEKRSVVVRAVQQVCAAPKLIGELCIADGLGLLDIRPANIHFPLLFIFTDTDGSFLGLRHMTFPGLCRGGLYYLEALSTGDASGPFDFAGTDESFADRLIALRREKTAPLVAELSVVIDGADGTTPLFQADFRRWLAEVMRVSVRPAAKVQASTQDYLSAAVTLHSGADRSAGIAVLSIAPDMIPSLSALCATCVSGEVSEVLAGSLVVTSEDRSIGTFVNVPPGTLAAELMDDAASLPTLAPAKADRLLPRTIPVLATRLAPRRPPSEAELLLPTAGPISRGNSLASITWFIWPEQWKRQNLIQSLQALAVQASVRCELVLVGAADEIVRDLAKQLFDSRLRFAHAQKAGVAEISTDYVGYLGAGILLHDRFSAAKLIEVLASRDVLTASPLLVRAEKRGKGYSVAPVASASFSLPATLLPNSFVPMTEPPLAVWAAQTSKAREWLAGESTESPSGRHVRATTVSASSSTEELFPPPFQLPTNSTDHAVTAEIVIG